jgi:hypothetical protein
VHLNATLFTLGPTLSMTISATKKVATSKAKTTTTKSKSASKTSRKNKPTPKNSQSQASIASTSRSQTSRRVSVSDEEDEGPTHIGGVLDVDSDHIMEPSDAEEEQEDTAKNPTEKSNGSEVEEDEEAELRKTLPGLKNSRLNSEQ